MLKSIELIGFKSFAKKGKLSFESPITAIVGPNGSGKSNTAEAFRFVLGEQGSKTMRIKKSTDLIWGGSHTLPRGSRAGVRVVLDNTNNQLSVDFNEVVIERTVLRDGTNEYSVNGSKVRLKDIQNLLSSANIGSSGHHIISQGQADRILGATPKERREMIEDALGLKSYVLKKVETEKKLGATNINLEKLESNKRELLPHLKYLEKQATAVAAARALRRELEEKFILYAKAEQEWIEITNNTAQEALSEPRAELREVEQRIGELRVKLNAASDGVDEQLQNALTKSERSVSEAKASLVVTRQELGKVLGRLEMLSIISSKASKRPETVPREAVRSILMRIIKELDSANNGGEPKFAAAFRQANKLAEKFIAKVLDAEQDNAEQDGLVQDDKELVKRKKMLEREVAVQTDTLQALESELFIIKERYTDSKQEGITIERDIYKETSRYNELVAIIADWQRKSADASMRSDRVVEDISEVEALLGKQVELTGLSTGSAAVPTRREIESLKIKVETSGGISSDVVDEYNKSRERYNFLERQITDLQGAYTRLTELIDSLDKQTKTKFNNGLKLINKEFNTFFNGLFGGGTAELTLESGDAYDGGESKSGIIVLVKLPRKKVTALETLSGGERALASIALIFAMSQVNPPPFIILDETDAALDEANSQRYTKIVKQLSVKSQIILITHNRATMSAADTLYGVTMGSDGMSKLLSVKLTEAQEYTK